MSKTLAVLAVLGIVLVVSSGAYAAKGLLTGLDIRDGSVTGKDVKNHSLTGYDIKPGSITGYYIKNGSITGADIENGSLGGLTGPRGATGKTGDTGAVGALGLTGRNGAAGPAGSRRFRWLNRPRRSRGRRPVRLVQPDLPEPWERPVRLVQPDLPETWERPVRLVKQELPEPTEPTAPSRRCRPLAHSPPSQPRAGPRRRPSSNFAVPAGSYIILAKTNLSHTGAGDSIGCTLNAGSTTLDQIALKTLPALAAVPVSLQAVATVVVSGTNLSVECAVLVANGSANYSSLIAIPTN